MARLRSALPPWTYVALSCVVLLTFAAYSATLSYEFVFDDESQILANTNLRSWERVPEYFTSHAWAHSHPHVGGNYYRPLFLLWLFGHYQAFGPAPLPWHLSTVLLHVVVTLLVFLLARRLLRHDGAALGAALLFGLHPVHIEAVAWVSGATEPLLAAFGLGSLLCFIEYRERGARAWLAASAALFALALLTKETALALPLLMAAYAWLYRDRTAQGAIRAGARTAGIVLPFAAVMALYVMARIAALGKFSHTVHDVSATTMVLTWPSLLWFYVQQMLVPAGLSGFYDTPYVTSPFSAVFWLPLLGVVALGAGLTVWAWNSRAAAFSALVMLLPLVLLLNLRVFAEGDIAHDRYLYVPSVGFVLLVALGLERLAASGAGRKRLSTAAVVVLAVAYLGGLLTQSGQWRDDLSLYQRGVAVAPNNPLPRNNLANELLKRGQVEEAMAQYELVLRQHPGYWLANYNLGYALYRQGRYPEAALQLSRAIRINAADPDQFLYLGLTHMRLGNLSDAEGMVRHALSLNPRGYAYHMVLATVLDARGQREQAREALAREVAQHPENKAALQLQAQWKAQD